MFRHKNIFIFEEFNIIMTKHTEIAKSFFVLAQLFVIIGGFLFASYGIQYTLNENLKNNQLNSLIEATKLNYDEMRHPEVYFDILNQTTTYQKESITFNDGKIQKTLNLGLWCIRLAFLFWIIGFIYLITMGEK